MAIRIVLRFFSSLARGISQFFTNTQNTQQRGWKKKKNKQTRTWVSSKCKRGEVGDTFVYSVFLWANASVYSSETLTSHEQYWLIFSRWSTWHLCVYRSKQLPFWLLLTGLLSALLLFLDWPSLDCSLLPTGLFCSLLLTVLPSSLGLSFPRPLPVSWEISRTISLCGFCAKTDKGIVWLAPTHTQTTNGQHRVTIFLFNQLWIIFK